MVNGGTKASTWLGLRVGCTLISYFEVPFKKNSLKTIKRETCKGL